MDTENKTQLSLLFLLAIAVITTVSTSSIAIFADDEEDEESDENEIEEVPKGEVGEKGETITKLVATGHDKKLTTMVTVPKPTVAEEPKPIPVVTQAQKETAKLLEKLGKAPVAEVAAEKPVKNQTLATKENKDKGIKLVLGDIVLPISQSSDFELALPFSTITVKPTPVK